LFFSDQAEGCEFGRAGAGLAAFRLVVDGIALCILTAVCVVVLGLRSGRFPSLRPTSEGFPDALAALCACPQAEERAWRHIVIHHSATTEGGAAAFARYHVFERGWGSLAYHFVIGNGTQTADGEIEVGPRWRRQEAGAHAGVPEYNEHGIGICLVGDFTVQHPTELQMHSLEALVRYLMRRDGVPARNVLGHRECPGAATECPGDNFPMDGFRRLVASPPES